MQLRETLAERLEVRVEVEGGGRRGDRGPGPGEDVGDGAGHDAVQAAAAVDVVDEFVRLGEGVRRGLLDGCRGARPDLAGHPEQAPAQTVADLGVRQAQDADPPTAQGQVLAQATGDDGALGRVLRGAVHDDAILALGAEVDQVAVDLVGDDDEIEFAGDLGEATDGLGRGDGAGRVVRDGDDDGVDRTPLFTGVGDGGVQEVGLGYAALAGGGRHHDGALSHQAALRGVADPAGRGDGGVPTDLQQEAVEQGLASGTGDDHAGVGREPAAFPVTGGGLAQGCRSGDGTVGVGPVSGGEAVPHDRVHRQPGLPEAERQNTHPLAALVVESFVDGEGGGHSDGHGRLISD